MEIPGFKLYRKDRSIVNDKKGGGVALYVKNSLNSVECDLLNAESCESVWCRIAADKSNSFIVGVCYRSPDADGNEVDILFQTIKTACTNNKSVLILGDFNYPNIDWLTFRGGGNNDYEFLKLILDCYLEQHVQVGTRGKNILDLIFTSELIVQDDVKIIAPIGNSDHNVLLCNVVCKNNPVKRKMQLRYNQGDYDGMRAFVKKRLFEVNTSANTASEMWCILNTILQEAITNFIPHKLVSGQRIKPLWMNNKVLRSVKKKHKLWNKWKQNNDDSIEIQYKKQVIKASKVVKAAKRNFERKLANDIKQDSKSFLHM